MNCSLKTSVNGFAARTKLCSFLQDLAALLLRRVASADMLRQPTISLCDQETCSVTFSHPRGSGIGHSRKLGKTSAFNHTKHNHRQTRKHRRRQILLARAPSMPQTKQSISRLSTPSDKL
uniref:Uncharacterized protein n=1 Tax=Physcomitrium patens TaxID=3218 RepID=A0A2K1JDT8_PHYPA|nr:hypothetical protein PHYPA_019971 [Physcomitrium patens]